MKVIEIFDSIDGEGIRTGQCATFIRLAGCNLRCSYCDTVYSLFGEESPCEYTEMTVDEIISKVNMTYKRVTLTGGEPLVHTDSAELVSKLTEIGCDVNIETNGAVDIVDFLGKVSKSDNLFFTIDYKLPSSGMTDKMIWNNFINLRPCDVIKFVILDEQMVEIINADRGDNRYLIFLRKPMGIELSPNYFGTLCKKDGELQLEYECYVRGWA